MRKSMLLAAAALTLGVLSASAQGNVYSVNIVGYVNVQLTNGMNLIANNLDKDGTGTNNTLYTAIGTNVPNLTRVYAFDSVAGTYRSSLFNAGSGQWTGTAVNTNFVNSQLNPGGAVFVQIPALPAVAPVVTFVGNVLGGTNTIPVSTIYALYGSKLPIGGTNLLQVAGGFTPANLDRVIRWNPAIQNYISPASTYNSSGGAWAGAGAPNISVGEGFWLLGHAGTTWTQVYTNAP